MQRTRFLALAAYGCLGLWAFAEADEKQLPIDPYKDNLLTDGDMHFAPAADPDKSKPPKVFLRTPRYWTLVAGGQKLEGEQLPFDTQVKFAGDASVRIEGRGGKTVFSKVGWADTRHTMRHSWAYTAGVHLKLKDVAGKVYVKVGYSWGSVQCKELAGTMDWTPVTLDFQCDRGTNLLQGIDVVLEGTGTVWVSNLQLHMKEPDALKWWRSWNGYPLTARLSEAAGMDEKAGVLAARPADQLDQYGGVKSIQGSKGATGFFHVEKIDGKWWLITPGGHGFYKVAMFSPAFTGYDDYNNTVERIGGRGAWAVQTYRRLASWGFNTLEWQSALGDTLSARYAKPPKELEGKRLAHTINLRFELCTDAARNGGVKVPVVDWGWQRFPDVFSDEFAKAVENYGTPGQKGSHFGIRPDDPWLIGYLLADEPPWYGPEVWYGSLTDGFHGLPSTAAGKIKWMEFLKQRYGQIEKLNNAWESGFASWHVLGDAKVLPRNKASVEDRRDFMGLVADRWYGMVVRQARRYDKNHLMLGGNTTRLYPTVLAAEAKSVDTLCASMYGFSGCYRPATDNTYWLDQQIVAWTGKPIMLGFCSTQADAGGINDWKNASEMGGLRGQTYASYLRAMAAHHHVLGVFWWTWSSWTEPSEEGYSKNWGVVDSTNHAYLDLLPRLQRANLNVYRHRLGKAPDLPEAPTMWWPSHGMLLLDGKVEFQLSLLPYAVDAYEIEVSKADGSGAQAHRALPDRQFAVFARTLDPGQWQWRARSTTGGKVSDWSLPFVFEVASAPEIAALAENNKAISDGGLWKRSVFQEHPQNAEVKFTNNAQGASGQVPMILEVPKGQAVRRIELACALPKPLVLRKGVPYSLRVKMLAHTEAGAQPYATMVFQHGYRVTEDYAPIDKGWSVQHELSGGKITHVRTSVRPPKDMLLERLLIRLDSVRGRVEIVTVELAPETEYEVFTTVMDDYNAIVKDYHASVKKY